METAIQVSILNVGVDISHSVNAPRHESNYSSCMAQLAGVVQYTDCISAKEYPHHQQVS